MKERKTVAFFVLIGASIAIMFLISNYFQSYPKEFQINGKFSCRGLSVGKCFQNADIVTSFFLLRTLQEDDHFNMTMKATRGWEAQELTILNASIREYPIIYDEILFQMNGSVSLSVIKPRFLIVNLQNSSVSVSTGTGDRAFFVAEAGKSLLLENITSANIPLSDENDVIYFQVVGGGEISVSNGKKYSLGLRDNDFILIRLKMTVTSNAMLAANGKFGVETNSFSSATFECWTSPLTAYFHFPEGFLSHAEHIRELGGSQNLNLTDFRGEIVLISPETPHEITIQGYSSRVFVGQVDVAAPDFLRDLLQTDYFVYLMSILASAIGGIVGYEYKSWRSREKDVEAIHRSSLIVEVKGIAGLRIDLTNNGDVPIDRIQLGVEASKRNGPGREFSKKYVSKTMLPPQKSLLIQLSRDLEEYLINGNLMRIHLEEIPTGETDPLTGEYVMEEARFRHITEPFSMDFTFSTEYTVDKGTKKFSKYYLITYDFVPEYGDFASSDPECRYSDNFDIKIEEIQWTTA